MQATPFCFAIGKLQALAAPRASFFSLRLLPSPYLASSKTMIARLIASPWALIILSGVVGFLLWGGLGLVLGLVGGLLITLLIGGVIRIVQGGSIPRRARRELITNILALHHDVVEEAYPDLRGEEITKELADVVEQVMTRAVSIAPTHGAVWSEPVVGSAVIELMHEAESDAKRELFRTVLIRMHADWYATG